ncbi:MAG: type II secretion system F family protein [Rhodomicrobium sp.]
MMTFEWFGIHGTAHDFMPLMSLLALMGGGAMLFFWGVRMNSALPARRLALMRDGALMTAVKAPKYAPGWQETSAGWYAHGLTNEERWQIVRSFAKLSVPASLSLALFAGTRFFSAAGSGVIAYLASPQSSPMLPAVLGAAAAITVWLLHISVIRIQLKQHRKSVGSGLPDALELLAVCVGAGLSLENALQRVSAETKISRPALSDELALTWADISISPNRDQALANMAERVNLPAVRSVIGTLSQSLRFGTPLAQSLRSAASEMRTQQLIGMEERANRLPAMLTIPVMLFIMPSMFLIIGGPAALKIMDLFAGAQH